MCKTFFVFLVVLGLGALLATPLVHAAMSSASYSIPADGITFGGVEATSTTYGTFSSIGGPPAGNTTSSSYIVRGGFLASDDGSLTLSLSSTSLSLGTLSASSVASGSTVATVNTNSGTGYTLSIGSVSGTGLTGVSDGTVTAGSEEYGVAVAGSNRAFTTDQAIAANLVLASYAGPVTNDQITLTVKASITSNSTAGSYSQSITLSEAANF
ncbi:MAG: hypothetical protein EXS55_04155 [Candidatus Magasanikbacteria bacterium]|nr:hypothetical protein [Candidatus Magasanikbacteria bacterium]